jgi:hypothetical protein
VPPDAVAALEHQFDEDERAQLRSMTLHPFEAVPQDTVRFPMHQ